MMYQDHNQYLNRIWWRTLPAIVIAGIAAILLLSINSTITPLQAAPNVDALVRIAPVVVTTTTTAISVPVDIRIENVNGLYGADVRLTFDPALLAVQDADPVQGGIQVGWGPLLTSGGYFVVRNTVDNISGTVWLALTQLNPTLPITGSGVLAHITFKPVGPAGASSIHFTHIELVNRTGNSIPSTMQDGTLTLQSVAVDLSKSTKLASNEVVSPTSHLTYTIALTNWGSSLATGVALTDVIPISTTYVPGSLSGSGAIYNASQHRIEWSGSISSTGSITLTYAVIVNANRFATIINDAYVSRNNILDRVLTVETQVTPSGDLPPTFIYLPLVMLNF